MNHYSQPITDLLMKKSSLPLALIGLALASVNTAQAADTNIYAGIKTGIMSVDVAGFDNTSANMITIGYKITDMIAVEAEIGQSNNGDIDISGVTGDYEIETTAIYLAFRSKGPFYVMGRAGYLNENLKLDNSRIEISGNESGLSLGVGAGYNFGPASIELGYTQIEEDVAFTSIGVFANF